MDKLRILPLVFVCGLLPPPAFAQLTTIGPGTPGVTESVMTLTQTGVSADGFPFFSPVFTPIPLGSEESHGFYNAEQIDPSNGCLPG